MENPATNHPKAGPWNGIDETRSADGKLRDALNVIARDGRLMRRPGRQIVLQDAAGRRVAGLHAHVAPNGDRSIVVFLDAAGASSAGLAVPNWAAAAFTDVGLPAGLAAPPAGQTTAAVPMDGHTILAEPGGSLLDFDGSTVALLVAVAGLDAAVGNEAYLASPPKARHLAVWRDRVVAAGAQSTPRLVALSENRWADPIIPDGAPIGGANVWPQRTNFDLNTDEGDVIQAITVSQDRLWLFGQSALSVVDEDNVQPYARAVARQFGCIAPRSVVNIGDATLYLGERHVLLYESGVRPAPVSGPMRRTLDKVIDWDAAHEAVAVHLRQTTEYRIWLPVKGLVGNQLCLTYNYGEKTWWKHAHWPLFDESARRDLPYKFDCTAALAVVLPSGREILLTGDSAGRVWVEDVGEDDAGQVFPSFAALGVLEDGAEWETFTDTQIECLQDGSFVGLLGVLKGGDHEQEIVRVLAGELPAADDTPYVVQRALAAAHPLWGATPAWPVKITGPLMGKLNFGLRARGQEVQPVIILPGQAGGVVDPAPGGVKGIQLGMRPRAGRRS